MSGAISFVGHWAVSGMLIVGHWAVSGMLKLYRNIVRIPRDPFVLRQFNNCMSRVATARMLAASMQC